MSAHPLTWHRLLSTGSSEPVTSAYNGQNTAAPKIGKIANLRTRNVDPICKQFPTSGKFQIVSSAEVSEWKFCKHQNGFVWYSDRAAARTERTHLWATTTKSSRRWRIAVFRPEQQSAALTKPSVRNRLASQIGPCVRRQMFRLSGLRTPGRSGWSRDCQSWCGLSR